MTDNYTKPNAPIIGVDGNIFNLLGIASRALKENLYYNEANEMSQRVMNSKSYDEALGIILEYIEPTHSDQIGEPKSMITFE